MHEKKEDLEFTLYDTLNISDYLKVKGKEPVKSKPTSKPPKETYPSLYEEFKKKTKPKKENIEKIEELEKIKKIEQPPEQTVEEPLEQTMVLEAIIEESKIEKKQEEPIQKIQTPEEPNNSMQEEPEENEKEKPKTKKKTKHRIKGTVITCIILDVLACLGLFLTYGPISYFRNLLITSAMTTMNHKYLARTFYSEETIQKVLAANHVQEIQEETNSSDINFEDGKDTGEYESVYEEQILKREEGNDLYKVIEIKENSYKGYLVAVYDASRVHLVGANNLGYGGAFLTDIAKNNKAVVAMNASGFYDGSASGKGSVAVGTVIQNGKVVTNSGKSGMGGGLAGFNKDGVLVLTKKSAQEAIKDGMVDAVEFGPFLIVNGKSSEVAGNGGWGLAPRTVLAQRQDGIVLFLVIDGRGAGGSVGAGMNDLIDILKRYKAYNAVNLDGGGSSTLVVKNKLTNHPSSGERYVPNAWIVK